MRKGLIAYVVVFILFAAGIAFVMHVGTRLYSAHPAPAAAAGGDAVSADPRPAKVEPAGSGGVAGALAENLRHPAAVLLLQVIVILASARLLGAFLRRAGQPMVIGEMIAGILLGPSLLGMLWPGAMAFLFPPQSLDSLRLLSQLGVIVFMFIVGMDLDLRQVRRKAHAAVLVSHVSILAPLFLGAALSLLIYRSYAPPQIGFTAFALFMGVAMSITAFPVLARILEERGISKTQLGSTAIACAAVDDVTAWCLLAVVIAVVKASGLWSALLTMLLTALFIAAMLSVVKKQAERVIPEDLDDVRWRGGLTAAVMMFVFASAFLTEVIGIHALFGAFLAGVVMPSRNSLRKHLTERLETFTTSLLLPLFFAFTGLRTQLGLLGDWPSWLMCLAVIAVAIAGKLGGSMLAARWTGMSWHDSLSLGVLMNTRGLIELIVLNIGYDLGILSPRVFSMMVVMALATTFMTGPLLSLITLWERRAVSVDERVDLAV